LNDALYNDLKLWIERHYRDRLSFEDLRDPKLVLELKEAAEQLESILGLSGIYQL
jgi:succinylarginine dihydrolase